MIGKKFGRLTVLKELPERRNDKIVYECQCDCGNTTTVLTYQLKSGGTKSCGCLKHKTPVNALDLTNKRFGKLIALYPTNKRKEGNILWHCKCDCGNEVDIRSSLLSMGLTTSCGCQKSKGESKIIDLLKQYKISFETQKTFDSCKFSDTNCFAYFDFYIDNSYIVEYDGILHYKYRNSGWNNKENFEKIQEHDQFKNKWCKENNIPLIRIPYTHFNDLKIEDLLLESSPFIVR